MTLFRRTDNEVQLYFNCPEKMDRITRMCKYTNYKDMAIIITTIGEGGLEAKHRIKFGKGWMGKGAEIRSVVRLGLRRSEGYYYFYHHFRIRRCGRMPARKSKRQNPPRSTHRHHEQLGSYLYVLGGMVGGKG